MAPWHVGVVAELPAHVAGEVEGLRRALGDPTRAVIAPHVTLVPPLRVGGADLGAALTLLRAAAAGVGPFVVGLGPVATFAPVSPTVHLSVTDPSGALARLHAAIFRPPLWRDTFPFVPHVTLHRSPPLHVLNAARVAFGSFRAEVELGRLTVLGERREDGVRVWRPLADAELDGVRIIGRGGLELELTCGTMIDPEALAVVHGVRPGPYERVVTARREGEVVGVCWEDGGDPAGALGGEVGSGLVVRADVRGQGIGRHLRNELDHRRAQQAHRTAERRAAERRAAQGTAPSFSR